MKIDAWCEVTVMSSGKTYFDICVPVDCDYVRGDADDVITWIRNSKEIEELCIDEGLAESDLKISVLNLDEVVEDISYDEFADKTQYANV